MPEATFASWYRNWVAYRRRRALGATQETKRYIKSTKKNLKDAISSDIKDHIVYYSRNLENYKTRLEAQEKIYKSIPGRLTATWSATEVYKKLLKHPLITGIIIDGERMRVATKNIHYDEYDQDMGRFDMQFPSKSVDYVRIYNLDWYYYGDIDHPHIEEGRVCLGDFSDALYKFETSAQLFLTVDGYIHYLKGADNDEHSYVDFDSYFADREPKGNSDQDEN